MRIRSVVQAVQSRLRDIRLETCQVVPAVLSCPLIAEPETIPSVSYISSVWLRFAFVTSLGCKEPIVVAWALGIDVTRGISLPNSDSVT